MGAPPLFVHRRQDVHVISLERPHSMAFTSTPETFGELVERAGIIAAPYMARHMWVQEHELAEALERREFDPLIRTAYALVVESRREAAEIETAWRAA
jgi:predicted DNA-binding protein (MmcQ/YjbR family)